MTLKQELHEALMDAFRDEKDLEIMLDYKLDWKLNQMAGGNNYEQIVYDLVKKAEAKGQLEQLLEAAIAKNPLNPKLIKLKKFYLNHITEDEIKNLKLILEEINFRTVKSSFLEILPEGAKEDNVELNEVKSTDNIINILCKNYSNTSSNVPRIIKLVEHIVNNSDTDKSQKLVNWLNQVSSRLKIEISNVQSQPVESNCNLLFIVYPESKFFRIETAYTQNGITKTLDYLQDTNSSSVSVNNKQRQGILCSSFQEIPKVLDKIIKYFIEKHSAEDSLIEIYLPYQYLYEDIDNWKITNDRDEPIALLQDFKVILHSSDRITGVHNYRNLNLGWKRFKDILAKLDKQTNQDIIHQYIESVNENIKRDELTKKLKSQIGIKLTKPLLNNSTDKQEFILTVLGGGVPFAFWIKCKPSRSRKLEQIDCYLTLDYLNNNLQKLIEQICHLRRKAYCETKKSKPLGCYLGFWCDDPDKIQKIKQLSI